ncbi:MAG: stage II sporulation protein P, partial [Oscillospiraceae bacterium]|nr:stage II sporulation protein P [Oscillospiraceae bacterium]
IPPASALPAPEAAVLPEETAPETDEPLSYAPIPIPDIVIDPPLAEENKAALVHKTYTAAPSTVFIQLEKGFLKNLTHHPASDILAQIKNPPYFTLSPGSEPQVLIMHTHTTESYFPFTGDYYDTTYPTRSTDSALNMAAVGNVIADRLTAAGIGVLHDTTQHDHPSYNGSYDRSAVTVKNYLEKYPSIKIVLDVHRDAIISGDTVTAPVVEIDGQTAAQVMIISGCDNGKMNYPDYMKNLSFAAALQHRLESDHPGFTRPILFDYRKYNQHLTTGSLLLEVGSHGNTLEQALLAAEWIGDSLGILLNELRK